jgi:3-methyladenine DNA glycosylase Tag
MGKQVVEQQIVAHIALTVVQSGVTWSVVEISSCQ